MLLFSFSQPTRIVWSIKSAFRRRMEDTISNIHMPGCLWHILSSFATFWYMLRIQCHTAGQTVPFLLLEMIMHLSHIGTALNQDFCTTTSQKPVKTLSMQNLFMYKLESVFVFIIVSRLLCLTRCINFFYSHEEESLTWLRAKQFYV